ncbi:formimidoylglutamate deiminase [Aliirhizobium cellulosilyticum]|uniref:Formiminoglutamate deiminase n=1 Tax=Aliirhizobium cellulosilyticum TaxID=393664 RepID=A0A7W6Y4A4_9HYPH|nr:formimidoylglutamate deiminase [Rhizobium cellulosilyticum]MBB4349777.1 formiminoglutamate deiminase [Rhizobium cellulosilyticum]MBB4412002.1 formiminoglutamate deiminase [Rhizobium cellulosilyticum]MBB4446634.1 formiminoglutamate deiminase [Rhizobium cellulosilyticum]
MTNSAASTLHAGSALLPQGWASNVRISVTGGVISNIDIGVDADATDERHSVLVPAMSNLHSHAFQRAMSGLAELRGPTDDSFWSWRVLMYRFALQMTPEQIEAVAAQLYMEMLEAGFCRVGEFHYLHHDRDGSLYANIAEHAERIGAASAETGIGLTLLPVFYAHSGFRGKAPIDGQRRFINSIESFGRLMEASRKMQASLPGMQLGIAPHSLRAVTPDELTAILPLAEGGPVHIHVAEQTKEVDDCIAWSGARPVEWLLDHAPVDDRWCLIHATHLTAQEVANMAQSGAVAGLCPITEANLGDGTFAASAFLAKGGRLGVGSDSNVLISLSGELRQLEYSQRLAHRARNVIAAPNGSTGRRLFDAAIYGGAQALATKAGLVAGAPADIVALDIGNASYLAEDSLLDNWIFGGDLTVESVWASGNKQVVNGRHVARDKIRKHFAKTMQALLSG